MKITADERLFWFLKRGSELDLNKTSDLELFMQQVLSRGRTEDVKYLLKIVEPVRFEPAFRTIEHFLSSQVRSFWNDFLANH